MKKYSLLLPVICMFIGCHTQPGPNNTWYLAHITVVDVIDGNTLTDMTVAITDSIISAVGPTGEVIIPRKAKVIDCRGKYVIPGLWDMHVHLGNATRSALPLFIISGVTGVRDMGSPSFDSIRNWRSLIRQGRITGPRIISPGPILNGGHPDLDFQIGVNSPEKAVRVVDSLAGIGVDFIKVHASLSKETYYAIAGEAARLNIPYAGHIPVSGMNVLVSGEEASEAGQRSLEHMLGIPFARDTIKSFQHMYPTEESLAHLFSVLLKNGTYVTPTLSVYQVPADYQAIRASLDSLLKYIAPELKSFWDLQTAGWSERNDFFDKWMLKARMNMVPELSDAGIPLLAGTDTGFPFVLPGFGLPEELEYLVAAGLTPLEALRTTTINPAKFLGEEDRSGSVEKGKRADLVILSEDPLKSIKNLHSIEAVIAHGLLYDRQDLNALLNSVGNQVKH